MKVFVSWSGELSRKIAEELKNWIPCIIQSVEIFCSTQDIEKGENWDRILSNQLSECNFGIIYLTSENTNSPWINFEAGAIAKALDSKISALMININTSDIQGPLKRFQATRLDKDDMFSLLQSINNSTESPLDTERLTSTFEAIWETMSVSIDKIVSEPNVDNPKEENQPKLESDNNKAIEETLKLLRQQNTLLHSPDELFPLSYLQFALDQYFHTSGDSEYLLHVLIPFSKDIVKSVNIINSSLDFSANS